MAISVLGGWLISAGAVVVTGAAGAGLALSGVFVAPQVVEPGIGGLVQSTSAHACAGGPVIGELYAGDRVLVVAQSDDAEWVGVRNPQSLAETLWLPITSITLDEGEAAAAATVPVGGDCATVTIVADAETPSDAPSAPADDSGAAPARDTAAPTISSASSQYPLMTCDDSYLPAVSVITIDAADNVGVTAVTATWSGAYTGQASATRSGGSWVFTFDATGPGTKGDVQFVITAVDAAGNTSSPAVVVVNVDCIL